MDIGESLVAAYLREIRGCDLVTKNVHAAEGQAELDVVGLTNGPPREIWLCEVTTHIRGMNNPARRSAAQRMEEKISRARSFASGVFPNASPIFEIWSPLARPAIEAELRAVQERLAERDGLTIDLVINDSYTDKIQELAEHARTNKKTTGEDAYRLLQILTSLRGELDLNR